MPIPDIYQTTHVLLFLFAHVCFWSAAQEVCSVSVLLKPQCNERPLDCTKESCVCVCVAVQLKATVQ